MSDKIKKCLPVLMAVIMLTCAGCDEQKGKDNTPENPKSKTTVVDETKKENDKSEPNRPVEISQPSNPNETKNKETRTKSKMNIKVYYPDESGLRLIGVKRKIEIADNENKYKAAIDVLMEPPNEKNLTTVIPKSASVISIEVQNGMAVINLDKSIQKGFVGGSTGEEFLIGSIVNTLTEFDEVKCVKFLIDGKEIESLAGHMDLTKPFTRMDYLMKN